MLGLVCPIVRIFVLYVELEQEIRIRRLAPPLATQFTDESDNRSDVRSIQGSPPDVSVSFDP